MPFRIGKDSFLWPQVDGDSYGGYTIKKGDGTVVFKCIDGVLPEHDNSGDNELFVDNGYGVNFNFSPYLNYSDYQGPAITGAFFVDGKIYCLGGLEISPSMLSW